MTYSSSQIEGHVRKSVHKLGSRVAIKSINSFLPIPMCVVARIILIKVYYFDIDRRLILSIEETVFKNAKECS